METSICEPGQVSTGPFGGAEGRMSVGVKLKCLEKGFGHSLGAREFQKEFLPSLL